MSDSDSDALASASSTNPSAKKLGGALRDVVVSLQRAGKSDELTVNNVRAAAEEKLGLSAGFFKNGAWKDKSKTIIRDQADQDAEPEKELPKSTTKQTSSRKRKSPDAVVSKKQKPKKRRVDEQSEVESDFEEHGHSADEPKKQKKGGTAAAKSESDESPLSDLDTEEPETQKSGTAAGKDDSDSEMSVLIDDEPAPKKRGKKEKTSSGAKTKKKPEKSSGKPKKEAAPSDPDQEEIKRLQGWLVRCGIRKVWGKELKPYEGSKAKIRHLKELLSDAGMTGRFSQEKARQIKESRELAADLEAVQEGNKIWGTEADGDGEEEEQPKPRRRLAKGLKELDFISDGEETD